MKRIIILICFLGMLAASGNAIADTKPRATLGSGNIYLLYDLETRALCYVTSMGGISCIYNGNLAISNEMAKIIGEESEKYKNRKGAPPHMILLNQEPTPPKTEQKGESKKEDDL